jgi:hypothetical protein
MCLQQTKGKAVEFMTRDRTLEVSELMSQMNLDIQEYVINMLRHLKFAQNVLQKQNIPPEVDASA